MKCMREGCNNEALKNRKTCGKECFVAVRLEASRKAAKTSPWGRSGDGYLSGGKKRR